jgi:hypothetical protein
MIEDISKVPMGPVLHPTKKEFQNFREYVNRLESLPELEDFGMVKVH